MQPQSNNTNAINSIYELMPSFCDRCGIKFERADLEVVSSDVKKTVCKINCKSCSNTFLMHLASPLPGVATTVKTPLKSEMTTGELRKFSEYGKIDREEFLDLYIKLKEVNNINDFKNLFFDDKV